MAKRKYYTYYFITTPKQYILRSYTNYDIMRLDRKFNTKEKAWDTFAGIICQASCDNNFFVKILRK